MSSQPHAPNSGFTLLELLISMMIVALLAVTVLIGWRVAASAWQKANLRLQQSRTVLETNQLLQEQMASMVPYMVKMKSGRQQFFFQGDAFTARFLSRYSLLHRSSSGLVLIEYEVEEEAGGTKQLSLNEFPIFSQDELAALIVEPDPAVPSAEPQFVSFQTGPQTRVLLKGLQECRFEYFQPPTPAEAGAWVPQWPMKAKNLPQAMAIRIAAPAQKGELAPVAVVAAIRDFALPQQ